MTGRDNLKSPMSKARVGLAIDSNGVFVGSILYVVVITVFLEIEEPAFISKLLIMCSGIWKCPCCDDSEMRASGSAITILVERCLLYPSDTSYSHYTND